jgi:hypothetical protein
MTTISKCLAVLISVASFAFLGFVTALVAGGPNWAVKMNDLTEAYGYQFERSTGETPTWSVKAGTKQASVTAGSSPIAAQAVIAAHNDLKQKQQTEIDLLDAEIGTPQNPGLEERLGQIKKDMAADLAALEKASQKLTGEIEQIDKQISDENDQAIKQAQDTIKVQQTAQLRRDDAARLRNQIAETQADAFRYDVQRKKLADQLVRIQGSIERLEKRRQRLIASGAVLPKKVAPKATASTTPQGIKK